MTFQRRRRRRVIALIRALQARRSRVVAGGYDPSLAPEAYEPTRLRRRLHRPRRRGADVSRAAARARDGGDRAIRTTSPASVSATATVPSQPGAAGEPARARRACGLPDRAARVLDGYTFLGRPDGRRRDVARLHLRLQLLLDHRDARPQLPHLRSTACSPTSPTRAATARGRSSWSTTTSPSTSARFEALCRAIIDAGLQRHRLHRAGDDVVDCRRMATSWRR